MTLKNQSVIDPDLVDLIQQVKSDVSRSLNCVKVGQIKKFDGVKKTAEVQVLFKRVLPDDSVQSVPLLLDCPVFTLQGGGASVRMPITAGDTALVLFSDRNLDAWFKTGVETAPFTGRCHDLSDGIVLVGLNALTSTLANYAADEVFLDFAGAEFALKGGRARIKNVATDLLTLITGLLTTLEGISTVPGGGPLNAASIAALEAQKLLFQGLLY